MVSWIVIVKILENFWMLGRGIKWLFLIIHCRRKVDVFKRISFCFKITSIKYLKNEN